MRIGILAQYFFTAEQAGSARWSEIGRRLVRDGHDVTVVTGMVDNSIRRVPERYRGRWLVRESFRGMEVLRVPTWSRYRGSTRGRLAHYASYNASSMAGLLRRRRFDCVIATSPPLTVGVSGRIFAALHRSRFLFEVRDLWPMAAIELGVLRGRRTIRAAEALERSLYRRADRLVALTPGIGRYLTGSAGVPARKVQVVTNGFDPAAFADLPDPVEGRRRMGIEADFLVVQAGSIGPSDHLEVLIDAAERLHGDAGVRFLVVGDGDGRAALERRAREKGLHNVHFLDPVPRREVGRIYAAADLLVCHVPRFYADLALPNRFLDYLGTGRPILTSGTGDMAEALESCGSGVVIPPDDPEAMAGAIARVRARRTEFAERAGRRVAAAAARFGWDAVYTKYRAALTGRPDDTVEAETVAADLRESA